MQKLIAIGIIGLLAQCVDGTLGMGYGAFSASFLIAGGLMPAVASATVHTAEIFTCLISSGFHLRFGNVNREWLLPLIVPGVIGGAIGAYFLSSVPGDIIKPYVAGFLLLLGFIIIYRFVPKKGFAMSLSGEPSNPGNSARSNNSRAKLPLLGFCSAFVDAVGGGGWGPIATPGLILGENSEPRKAVGTVNLAEFFVTMAISATFFATIGWESFRWDAVAALLVGGAIVAPMAAYLCKRLPHRLLGVLVGLALIGSNLRTLIIALSG